VQLYLRSPMWVLHGCYMGAIWDLHNSTCTQHKKASEGALESSCRALNGLDAGWVGGVGLVEQWRHHVALFAHSNSFWPEIEVP